MSDQPANPDTTPQPTPLDAQFIKPAIVPTPTTDEVATEPKKGRRPLQDIKHEEFAKHYVAEMGNGAAAARALGYTNGSAEVTASRWTALPEVQNRIAWLAENAGIKLEKALGNVKKHLEAEKGPDMRWATDRALELHGVRGHSEQPKTVNNVGFIGLDQENMDRLAQTLLEKLNPQQDKS